SEALSSVVRGVLERASHIWIWTPFMLVIAIPSVLDGYMSWKIKRTNFDYSSPFLNRYGHQLAWLCFMLALVGLILPAPVPPVIIPAMCLAVIPIIGIWIIGNLPKRI